MNTMTKTVISAGKRRYRSSVPPRRCPVTGGLTKGAGMHRATTNAGEGSDSEQGPSSAGGEEEQVRASKRKREEPKNDKQGGSVGEVDEGGDVEDGDDDGEA